MSGRSSRRSAVPIAGPTERKAHPSIVASGTPSSWRPIVQAPPDPPSACHSSSPSNCRTRTPTPLGPKLARRRALAPRQTSKTAYTTLASPHEW